MKWQPVGEKKPQQGQEYKNAKLVEKLKQKELFSKAELNEMHVNFEEVIQNNMYIQAGEQYFQVTCFHTASSFSMLYEA